MDNRDASHQVTQVAQCLRVHDVVVSHQMKVFLMFQGVLSGELRFNFHTILLSFILIDIKLLKDTCIACFYLCRRSQIWHKRHSRFCEGSNICGLSYRNKHVCYGLHIHILRTKIKL